MFGIVYVFVFGALGDREILFDVLFTFLITATLIGLGGENFVPAKGKTEVTQALSFVKVIQSDMVAARAETGRWPSQSEAGQHQRLSPDRIVKSITIAGGSIDFVFADSAGELSGRTLTFRAAERRGIVGAPVLWLCGYAAVPGSHKVYGENMTDVPKKFLPEACRS